MDATPAPNLPPPQERKMWHDLTLGISVVIMVVISTLLVIAVGLWVEKGSAPSLPSLLPEGLTPAKPFQKFELTSTQTWINCNDIRGSLIEEGDRIYLACTGGILVISPEGKILDQFSMADGLKNNFINSQVLQGNTLYAGHQDGFSVINLTDRSIKNISVSEGLINGSNIILALDRQYLWVGTFDGLSRYDTGSGELKNFHEEFRALGNKLNTHKLLVTPSAVYIGFTTHASSIGGLVRFDKASETFEIISRSNFPGKTRPDFNDLVFHDGKVFVSDWSDMWLSEDRPGAEWQAHMGLQNKIKDLMGENFSVVKFVGFAGNESLIYANDLLFAYNPESRQMRVAYPEHWQSDGPNALAGAQLKVVGNNILWFTKVPGWNILRLDLNDFSARQINLTERPASFTNLAAVINNRPIFQNQDGELWQLGPRGFEKLLALTSGGLEVSPGGFAFQPIPGTDKVFVYNQVCGQGCSLPQAQIFDYSERSSRSIELSSEVLGEIGDGLGGTFNYQPLEFLSFADGLATFQILSSRPPQKAMLDTNTFVWTLAPLSENVPVTLANSVSCNPVFELTDGKFLAPVCPLASANYSWEIGYSSTATLVQTNLSTNETIDLTPPLAPKPYTPFEGEFFSPLYGPAIVVMDKLWLGTNRGLGVYEPVTNNWILYDTSRGLPSNQVRNFGVTSSTLWAITENGGLVGIKL